MNPQLPPMPPVMPPNPSLRRRLREGMRSTLALFQAGAFTLGGVGRHPLPVLPGSARRCAYTVREPDLIREVLVGRSAEFPKSILMDNMLRDIIGSSLFLANGETWRWRRAIVNPALQQARVTAVFERMREAGDAAVLRIGAASQAGPVRIDLEVTHFAADVIFRTIFSEPIDPRVAPRIIAAFETYQRLAYVHGLLEELHVPKVLRMGKGEKRRAAELIRSALKAPLDRRLALLRSGAPAPENDIAASLISQSDPVTGRSLNDAELLDEVAMLFLAGHETSASALATVDTFPQSSAAITFLGAASTQFPQNLVYHKDAITFATADLLLPQGVDMASRQVHNGISMRIVRQYDINNDRLPCRIDVLYGYGVIRPQMACRIWG